MKRPICARIQCAAVCKTCELLYTVYTRDLCFYLTVYETIHNIRQHVYQIRRCQNRMCPMARWCVTTVGVWPSTPGFACEFWFWRSQRVLRTEITYVMLCIRILPMYTYNWISAYVYVYLFYTYSSYYKYTLYVLFYFYICFNLYIDCFTAYYHSSCTCTWL